jgi:hydrogenase maturation factor
MLQNAEMEPVAPKRGLPAGKLPAAKLEAMLARLPRGDPRVLVGPRAGEDAAVIDLGGGRCLVVTTDPVTFATDRIGSYAVHVNANDVAVMGAVPRWLFLVVLLPAGRADAVLLEAIMADVVAACEAVNVTLCGGHTEITEALDRPILVGQAMGEVERGALLRKDSLQPGDVVILAGAAAVEGTAILAREKRAELEVLVPEAVLGRAAAFLDDPGISVVRAARVVSATGSVRAMHDPTEGGVVSGLLELAHASSLGIAVEGDSIAVRPETAAVCAALAVDPLRLISSGALLAACSRADAPVVLGALREADIPAATIAELRPFPEGYAITIGGRRGRLELPARDELARLFERG